MIKYDDKEYDKFKVTSEKVLIKKLKSDDLRKIGGIYIPESSSNKNMSFGIGQILQIGDSAKNKYNANEGDYVLYDYYSAFGDWPDSVIINAENLLLKLSEEESFKFLNEGL